MDKDLQNMLISILNLCFALTNTIPKYLNEPVNPELKKLCADLSAMLKDYKDVADKSC